MSLQTHGITTQTLENMILGAGVIYKNLTYSTSNGWEGTILGATSGGIKFKYEIDWLDIEVDGATVLVKGISRQKIGESATLEGQMTELTEELLVTAMHLTKATSDASGYTRYVSKESIDEEDDYLDNVAFVGTLSGGKQIIIILPNAICTEALELETKNATQNTYSVKFACTADPNSAELNHLDIQVYFPQE